MTWIGSTEANSWYYHNPLRKLSPTLRKDPRVLPIGIFLRKTKINELPQIINVLIGNMSVVSPRPQMEVDFYKFSEEVQSKIYITKPGITGIGSIVFRDEEELLTKAGGDPHEFYKQHLVLNSMGNYKS